MKGMIFMSKATKKVHVEIFDLDAYLDDCASIAHLLQSLDCVVEKTSYHLTFGVDDRDFHALSEAFAALVRKYKIPEKFITAKFSMFDDFTMLDMTYQPKYDE
jgi:hypothetical protein